MSEEQPGELVNCGQYNDQHKELLDEMKHELTELFDISKRDLLEHSEVVRNALQTCLELLSREKRMTFGDQSRVFEDDDLTISSELDRLTSHVECETIHDQTEPLTKESDTLDGLLDCIKPQHKEKLSYLTHEAILKLKTRVNSTKPSSLYTIKKQIGHGATGRVFEATYKKTAGSVAIKMIDLEKLRNKDVLLVEIDTMKQLQHDNIVNFIHCYLVDSYLWIAMEFMDGGSLTSVVEMTALKEDQVAAVSCECLKGLDYLHRQNIIHRDIKSDNIVLSTSGAVKLADFGFCARLSDAAELRETQVGTCCWMAPEIIRGQTYGNKVDLWSLGITVIEMLEGRPPYADQVTERVFYLIYIKGKPDIKNTNLLSPEIQHFLDRCLTVDPHQRASAADLLAHNFLGKAAPLTSLAPIIKAARKIN